MPEEKPRITKFYNVDSMTIEEDGDIILESREPAPDFLKFLKKTRNKPDVRTYNIYCLKNIRRHLDLKDVFCWIGCFRCAITDDEESETLSIRCSERRTVISCPVNRVTVKDKDKDFTRLELQRSQIKTIIKREVSKME